MGSGNTRRLGDLPVSINVSLCVSGKWTDIDFTERMREIIPHDNYYTMTYTDCDHDSTFKMEEPEFTYHPVLDTEPYGDGESLERRYFFTVPDEDIKRGDFHNSLLDFKRKAVHWNKQILIHNHMMKNIPKCDIVIRTRFDTVVSDQIDWSSHIKQSYEEDIPIGFNTLNILRGKKRYYNQLNDMQDKAIFYINDALIIHPYQLWNCDLVDELYKDKKLKGAEEGWYQVLSEPNDLWHRSYVGGAYLNEFWETITDVDASLHNHSS